MSFKEWLPIKRTNRIALFLAVLSLLLFVGWNFLPADGPHSGTIIASVLWPSIFSKDFYLTIFARPSMLNWVVLGMIVLLLSDLVILLTVIPFWAFFHAAHYLKLPIALFNLIGGLLAMCAMTNSTDSYTGFSFGYESAALLLLSLALLAMAGTFIMFENELSLRTTGTRNQNPRS